MRAGRTKQIDSLLAITVLLALSGCAEGGGGEIAITGSQINATDSRFALNSTVGYASLIRPTYHNLTVYLFTANGTVIAAEHIGTLKEGQHPRVTMQTDQIPKYVIVNSPEFWEYDEIGVWYWKNIDSPDHPNVIYGERVVSSREEFPVEVLPNSTDANSQ